MEQLPNFNDIDIVITDAARDFFLHFAKQNKKTFDASLVDFDTVYLRLKVLAGGCNGRVCSLELQSISEQWNPMEDTIVIRNLIPIIIDPKSKPLVKGLTIDYHNDLNDSGLKFTFFNAHSVCGCGKSWN